MIPDYQTLLIAAVFASQIFVLSFYTPIRWRQYHAFLLERYPHEEYPLLHPLPRDELERKFKLFRPLHLIIGAGSIFVLLGGLISGIAPRGLAGLMQMCLFVQVLLPLYIALPLAFKIKQGLKFMPPPSRRSAELRKWRVSDFISPLWIGLSIAVQALGLACAVAVYLYQPGTQGVLVSAIFIGAMLLASILTFFGDAMVIRADPYMSQADTFRVRQRSYRGLFLSSAAIAIWSAFSVLSNAGFAHLQLDHVHGFVIFSAICQLFGLVLVSRQNRDLTMRDFGVYRADGSAQEAR